MFTGFAVLADFELYTMQGNRFGSIDGDKYVNVYHSTKLLK